MVEVLVVGQVTGDEIFLGKDTAITIEGSLQNTRQRVGGKAFNIAAACARLGCKTALVSAVGYDSWGTLIRKTLGHFGIGDEFIPQGSWGRAKPVTTPVARLTEGRYGERHVEIDLDVRIKRFYSAAIEAAITAGKRWDAVIFTLEFDEDQLQEVSHLVRECRKAGTALVVGNPAPRRSRQVDPRVGELVRLADGVVPNRYEADYLVGSPTKQRKPRAGVPKRVAEIYGLQWCVTTFGADGWAWHDSRSGDGASSLPSVDPIDKVGASDVFTAAMVQALLRNISVENAAMVGGAAAKLTISRTGGADRFPTITEVIHALRAERASSARQAASLLDKSNA